MVDSTFNKLILTKDIMTNDEIHKRIMNIMVDTEEEEFNYNIIDDHDTYESMRAEIIKDAKTIHNVFHFYQQENEKYMALTRKYKRLVSTLTEWELKVNAYNCLGVENRTIRYVNITSYDMCKKLVSEIIKIMIQEQNITDDNKSEEKKEVKTEEKKEVKKEVKTDEKKEVKKEEKEGKCMCCCESDEICLIQPCGHTKYCINCVRRFKTCPDCRVNIQGFIRAFV